MRLKTNKRTPAQRFADQHLRPGRPVLSTAEKRSIVITLRLSPTEHARIKNEALKRGMTIADMLVGSWRNK